MGQRAVRLARTCGLALAVGALIAATVTAGVLMAATPPVKITTVRVVMTEYRFALSKRVVPVGIVIFKIVNKGQVAHNMVFSGPIVYARSPLLQPGQSSTLKIRVKKPGPYHFTCTLHFKLGMVGSFTAKKA
jgi:plastocyanin